MVVQPLTEQLIENHMRQLIRTYIRWGLHELSPKNLREVNKLFYYSKNLHFDCR